MPALKLYRTLHSHAPSPTSLPLVLTELLVDNRVRVWEIAVNKLSLLSELEEPKVRGRAHMQAEGLRGGSVCSLKNWLPGKGRAVRFMQ